MKSDEAGSSSTYEPVPDNEKPSNGGGDDGAVKATFLEGYLNFVRASIGPGCLALPFAFANAGYVLGPALLTLITIVVWQNMHSLIATRRRLIVENPTEDIRTYGDVGFYAMGHAGGMLVEGLLVLMELGICTVYFEFISTSLFTLTPKAGLEMEETYEKNKKDADVEEAQAKQLIICMVFPIIWGLAQIREMKKLAPFSGVANVFMTFGLLTIVGYACIQLHTYGMVDNLPRYKEPLEYALPLYFGTVIYCFEGCGAVLPIENSMTNAKDFDRVLDMGFITIYFVAMVIGTLCYISFSPIDSGSMTAVLREFYAGWPVDCINVAVATAVLLTYPLPFYAAIEVLEEYCGIGFGAEEQERLDQEEFVKVRQKQKQQHNSHNTQNNNKTQNKHQTTKLAAKVGGKQSYGVGGGAAVNPLPDTPGAEERGGDLTEEDNEGYDVSTCTMM
jgi:proton-coupled amino acid transporter